MRPSARGSLLLAVSALCASALTLSCSQRGGTVRLEAEAGLLLKLEALAAAQSLPAGWRLSSEVEPSQAEGPGRQPAVVVSLSALAPGAALPRDSVVCGAGYDAAAVELSDERFSVSPGEAQALGLLPLDSILPPRRALAVDGLWPGEAGYPFVTTLALSAHGPGGGPPRAIAGWLEAAAARARAAARSESPFVLAAAGDMQVGEYEWPLLAQKDGMGALLTGGLLDLIRRPDLAVANLETSISARGYPNPLKRFRFRMPPGSVAAFARAGFDLLLFANNHGFDFGPEAFEDSLADFRAAGLPMVGAGENKAEAEAPRYIDTAAGARLAFVGFAFFPEERSGFALADAAALSDRPGIAVDEEGALAAIRAAARTGATVVVLAHGGAEYVEEPSPRARAVYAAFVDAGAALVLGSHPHLLQGCEARGGSLIAYSLGNFLFTGESEPQQAWKSAVLDFLFYRGRVRSLRIHPVIAGYDYSSLDPDQAGAEKRFARLCAELAAAN
jgi:poly-gamma-glutamate capsule biosynthesis protein CapA/YwtB (metallophosphatase superfamily)